MKNVWKMHTMGKRILASFLLMTMLFDTVTANAMTYVVTAKVKKANGAIESKEITLKKAFVVNVKDLPASITFEKSKLTFSPYLEGSVATGIKSVELATLMQTGDFLYDISTVETTSKYKELAEDKKNDILVVDGNEDGIITIDNKSVPTKNATYYYLVTINLMQNDGMEPVLIKSYTAKLSVAVKATLPTVTLQRNTINLDNAFVGKEEANRLILSTGNSYWELDALSDANITIKSGKTDITAKGYFDIAYKDTRFVVSLNNRNAEGLMTVPKGTYKIIIKPTITDNNETDNFVNVPLKEVTLTVKVTSSRPSVKMSTSAKVTAGGEEVILVTTLSNKGKLTQVVANCTNKKPEEAKPVITLDANGNICIEALAGTPKGTYNYTLNFVTKIDGEDILLDAKSFKVTVK